MDGSASQTTSSSSPSPSPSPSKFTMKEAPQDIGRSLNFQPPHYPSNRRPMPVRQNPNDLYLHSTPLYAPTYGDMPQTNPPVFATPLAAAPNTFNGMQYNSQNRFAPPKAQRLTFSPQHPPSAFLGSLNQYSASTTNSNSGANIHPVGITPAQRIKDLEWQLTEARKAHGTLNSAFIKSQQTEAKWKKLRDNSVNSGIDLWHRFTDAKKIAEELFDKHNLDQSLVEIIFKDMNQKKQKNLGGSSSAEKHELSLDMDDEISTISNADSLKTEATNTSHNTSDTSLESDSGMRCEEIGTAGCPNDTITTEKMERGTTTSETQPVLNPIISIDSSPNDTVTTEKYGMGTMTSEVELALSPTMSIDSSPNDTVTTEKYDMGTMTSEVKLALSPIISIDSPPKDIVTTEKYDMGTMTSEVKLALSPIISIDSPPKDIVTTEKYDKGTMTSEIKLVLNPINSIDSPPEETQLVESSALPIEAPKVTLFEKLSNVAVKITRQAKRKFQNLFSPKNVTGFLVLAVLSFSMYAMYTHFFGNTTLSDESPSTPPLVPSITAYTRLESIVAPVCKDNFSVAPDVKVCGRNIFCWLKNIRASPATSRRGDVYLKWRFDNVA